MTRLAWFLLLLLATNPAPAAPAPVVGRYTPHEIAFTASGTYVNPYVELGAEATLTEPDGRTTRTLPLFWDGDATWKLRFAPDLAGTWRWSVRSADPGLHGRSGAFECVASTRRGSIVPMPGAPRHFQYQNGERLWFMGDTAWAYVTDHPDERHDRATAAQYLRRRAGQGFNVIHFMLLNEAGWGNAGGPPWHDIAIQRINPAYFREADLRVAEANALGVVTGIAVAWGNKRRHEPYSWGKLPDLAARQRFARYAAARYGAYDVYFIVSGEWHGEIRTRPAPEAQVRAEFVALGDALRAADPHRRMTAIHPMNAHGSTCEFYGVAVWMDFADYQQNYHDQHGRALAARTGTRAPVVNSEYGYFLRDQNGDGRVDKPHSYTVDDLRHATWDLSMAGAYWVTGFGSTYMGGIRHPTTFLPADPANLPWEQQVGRVRQFFSALEYWKLEPADDLLRCAAPRTADRATRVEAGDSHVTETRAPRTTYWCLAEPGRTYAVYVRGTRAPVSIAGVSGPGWQVSRFDPRTGATANPPAVSASGDLAVAAPDEQDWVFVVRRAGDAGR